MKYILYARKSTEDREDRQVLSIESQIDEVKRKFPELEVIEVIKESKSAYKINNRPEFSRMIEMLESGKAQGILAWHPDRISREPFSAYQITSLLDRKVLKDLKFVSYNFDNSPEGKMMLTLVLSQAKYFSEKLSVDVKRGMNKKCKLGAMPTKPPLGYMPDRMAEKGEKKHIKDPERFDLVRKCWDLMLTGQYTIKKIASIANSSGLRTRASKRSSPHPLSKNTIYKMFDNVFYAGKFTWDNQAYQGAHEAMISMEEFEQVQQIMGKRYIPRPKKYESLTSGLVHCSCGASIVLEKRQKLLKTKGTYETYEYGRCMHQKKGKACKEPPTPLKDIEDQMKDYLRRITISEAFHQWAVKNLPQINAKEQLEQNVEIDSLRKAHDGCKRRLDNLLELKISPENTDGSLLSNEAYKVRQSELSNERDRLSEAIKQIDYRADKNALIIQEVCDVAYNAQRKFIEAKDNIQEKKVILGKIGANFTLTNKKLDIAAKHPYIAFEKRLPKILEAEERCKLEKRQFGQPKESSWNEMISLWSG